MKVSGDPESHEDWRKISDDLMDEIGKLVASLRPALPDRRRPMKKKAA